MPINFNKLTLKLDAGNNHTYFFLVQSIHKIKILKDYLPLQIQQMQYELNEQNFQAVLNEKPECKL